MRRCSQSIAATLILGFCVCPSFEQYTHHVFKSALDCGMQRCSLCAVSRLVVGTRLQEEGDHWIVTLFDGMV